MNILTIFKVVGCCFLFLLIALCIFLLFFYLRERYALWQRERELPGCLERCDAIQGEILKITNEINGVVLQRSELSVEDEWRGYRTKLGAGVSGVEGSVGFLAMVWLMHNRKAMEWEFCPEQYGRRDDLYKRLALERERVALLRRIRKPYIMSNNYAFWRKYCNMKQEQRA